MFDFDGILQRKLDDINREIQECEDELTFYEHYVDDRTFLHQCGIVWPPDRSKEDSDGSV